VTESTRDVLLIVEGTAEHRPEALRQAFAEMIEVVMRYCGGPAER
jgi:DNA/RNA-binding domain of Phe-tRNA-synthetase-like protein